MIQITSTEVYSDTDKFIHRIGTGEYFRRSTLLRGDTVGNFEEVDEIPRPDDEDYGIRVNELVRRKYTLSEELAVLRQRDSKPEEFAEYYSYAESCKKEASEIEMTEPPLDIENEMI